MYTFRYPNDLVLDLDNAKKKKYDPKIRLNNKHLGQLKLFSNELAFILNHVFSDGKDKKKQIVYVGAGPGHHLFYLASMFPTIEWHLFDVRFYEGLRKLPNVYIEEKYFEDSDMEVYKDISLNNDEMDLYFISDIRDLSYGGSSSPEFQIEEELKIMDDMNLQRRWVEEIRPKASMLKFRLPFYEEEVVKRLGGEDIEYLDGIIYKQPWARSKSTESRLVILRENISPKIYSIKDYEQAMYYHNTEIRSKRYNFPLESSLNGMKVSKSLTLDNKYDSAAIITLLHEYFRRIEVKSESKIQRYIIHLLSKISLGEGLE